MAKRRSAKRASKQLGKEMGRTMGRTTRQVIEATHLTAKEASTFTSAFIENFRKELKKPKK